MRPVCSSIAIIPPFHTELAATSVLTLLPLRNIPCSDASLPHFRRQVDTLWPSENTTKKKQQTMLEQVFSVMDKCQHGHYGQVHKSHTDVNSQQILEQFHTFSFHQTINQ
jgi:hypothetical protein